MKQTGDTCNPEEWGATFECPAYSIDCSPPPEGCNYMSNDFVINEVRDCCPKPCYAVDGDGNDCSFDHQLPTPTPTPVEKVGDRCDIESFGCPSIMCGPPQEGCLSLTITSLAININGNCCRRCSSVDIDGNSCNSGSNVAANSWVYFFSTLVCFVYLIW